MNASGGKSNACAGENVNRPATITQPTVTSTTTEHHHGQPADVFDVAPQQRRRRHADGGRDQVVRERRHRRPDELQVVGEAHRAAGDRQRRDQHGLEDEQERHQPAEAERLERLAQVEIAAAAAGQRRAELRVDQAVGEREHQAGDPGVDDVRAVHGRDHERDGQERPDADHADDVGGGGLQQAHPRREGVGRGAWVVRSGSGS